MLRSLSRHAPTTLNAFIPNDCEIGIVAVMRVWWDVGFGVEVWDRRWYFCWSGSGDGTGVVYVYTWDASGFGEDAGDDAGS